MFCYQCEQTAQGKGCMMAGVCGKDANTASLQDLLLAVTKGTAMYAHRARTLGAVDAGIDRNVIENLFTTVTNVNFDTDRLSALIKTAVEKRAAAKKLYEAACAKAGKQPEALNGFATLAPAADIPSMVAQAAQVGIEQRKKTYGEDITGLMELLTYGLKGMAAYADHALVLGKEDAAVNAFFHDALDLLTHEKQTVDELFTYNMKAGEVNLKIMGLLDAANTDTYGHPEPTSMRITAVKGKCILVSGHDLKDLYALLEQTEGKGINIYTHGEMLPCNAYPKLKKFKHLVGNYGGAWQDQAKEFEAFPGAILMTTNCIQKPRDTYKGRIFTCGLVAWPGVKHISDRNFGPVIEAALAAPGFTADE
ncbi:hydroxylamine reductase, partial [Candidatus Ozemobacteraceae bacterium]|nr:hydroxylamine reductase [Candidatus Ozemobacteraceae bacterium]